MKDNKGFTLVELLAVIVILAIIMIIAAPSMTKEIARNETENKNILNQKIENASHIYAAKYFVNDLIDGSEISFTLNDLEQDGLINLKGKFSTELDEEKTIIISSGVYDYRNISGTNCYTTE